MGGHRGRRSSIQAALALWAAQLLPSLQADGRVVANRGNFLEQLRGACAEHFEVQTTEPALTLTQSEQDAYWLERYRQGNAQDRLITWMCTRHLSEDLQAQLEQMMPVIGVLAQLRQQIARRRKLLAEPDP